MRPRRTPPLLTGSPRPLAAAVHHRASRAAAGTSRVRAVPPSPGRARATLRRTPTCAPPRVPATAGCPRSPRRSRTRVSPPQQRLVRPAAAPARQCGGPRSHLLAPPPRHLAPPPRRLAPRCATMPLVAATGFAQQLGARSRRVVAA